MLNLLWLVMIIFGIVTATLTGRVDVITQGAMRGAQEAVEVTLGLIGILALWSGLMRIAEEAGLTEHLGAAFRPLLTRIFPEVPPHHPAFGAIVSNMSANLLGLGNAATPLGIKAMEQLETLNNRRGTATPAMCTLLAINTSSITLIPAMVLALRAQAGSLHPEVIIGPTIFATAVSTCTALIFDRIFRHLTDP